MKIAAATGFAATILLVAGISACSQTPARTADRTPSWQRYEVLGSRITRRVDASGQAAAASYTVTSSAAEWKDMPQVAVSRRRR